jgi:hypothetical protein
MLPSPHPPTSQSSKRSLLKRFCHPHPAPKYSISIQAYPCHNLPDCTVQGALGDLTTRNILIHYFLSRSQSDLIYLLIVGVQRYFCI